MNILRAWFAFMLALALSACGGGGSGGQPDAGGTTTGTPAATVSGYVLFGPVSGATVQLRTVGADGTTALVQQTTSDAQGAYRFTASPPSGAVILVVANGGTYRDEATSTNVALSTAARAMDVWAGSPRRVTVTAYSEVAVRSRERASTPDWSAAAIANANASVAGWLGLSTLTDFAPLDLSVALASQPAEQDFGGSLFAGAFSAFSRRLGPGATLPAALDSLYHLIVEDSFDDRLFPAFIGATADYIDLTALSADARRALKSSLLFGATMPLTEAQLAQGMPNGLASGAVTAQMPDDGFQLLDLPGAHTRFNLRGALVAYTDDAQSTSWHEAYTASVAEVYGDGDIGIGRWNGGTAITTSGAGQQLSSNIASLMYGSFHYAVAKAPASVPSCGYRKLSMAASTTPTLHTLDVNGQRMITGLTADSTLGLQFLGSVYLGADIGVQAPDGSVVRYRTAGGSDAPWMTGFAVGTQTLVLSPVSPAGTLSNQDMTVSLLLSGQDANKVVVRLRLPSSNNDTEVVAAFTAPTAALAQNGCVQSGAAGSGISPLPADGDQYVFLHLDSDTTFLGAPQQVTFGSMGELKTVSGVLAVSGPVFELAGNADASIGRLTVTDKQTGASRSEPYAVVRPQSNFSPPAAGTVVYDLVAATSPMPARGTATSTLGPGQVNSASLSITFGEYPIGTPNPGYATAQLLVQGTLSGFPFAVSADMVSPAAAKVLKVNGGTLFDSNIEGALAGTTGDYVGLHYQAAVGLVPIDGTLLFHKH